MNILYLGDFMPLKTLAEKIAFVKKTRFANYRESLRLEGVSIKKSETELMSKKEVIAKYRVLAS